MYNLYQETSSKEGRKGKKKKRNWEKLAPLGTNGRVRKTEENVKQRRWGVNI